jgi:hypothetical protein
MRSGLVSITDDAPTSLHTAGVSGKGIGPAVTLSPTSLSFPARVVGTSSLPLTVTVNNTGNAALNVAAVGLGNLPPNDFKIDSETCTGGPVSAGASCVVRVVFAPVVAGSRSDSLVLTDDAFDSPQALPLSGTGLPLPCDQAYPGPKEVFWNSQGSGSWHTATNWKPAVVPGATNDVCINQTTVTVTYSAGDTSVSSLRSRGTLGVIGGSLTITKDSATARLDLNGGTINRTAAFDVTIFNWNNGTLGGAGSTSIPNTGALNFTSYNYKVLAEGTLNNAGPATLADGGSLYIASYGKTASFSHLAGATFEIAGDMSIYPNGGTASFVNAGALRKSVGPASSSFSVPLTNSGSVSVDAGLLALEGGSTNTGPFSAAAAAILQFGGGTHTLNTGAVVSGAGEVRFANYGTSNINDTYSVTGKTTANYGSKVNFNKPIASVGNPLTIDGAEVNVNDPTTMSVSLLNLSGGRLNRTGPLDVTTFNWSAGTLGGKGSTTTSALTFSTYNWKMVVEGRLITTGTTKLAGGGSLYIGDYGKTASITNSAGATFDIQGDMAIYGNGGTASFVNDGTLKKSVGGTGSTTINVPLTNSGNVSVDAGWLALEGGSTNTGPFSAAAAAILQFGGGTHTLNTGAVVSGAGEVRFANYGTTTLNDAYSVTGPTTVNCCGTVNFNKPANLSILNLNGGVLNRAAALNATTFNWSGGTLSGPGSTSTGTLNVSTYSGKVLDQGTLTSTGTATLAGTGSLYIAGSGKTASFTNPTAATFDIQGDIHIYNNGGTASFINNGMLKKSTGTGVSQLQIPLTNNNTLQAQSGAFAFQHLTNSGSLSPSALPNSGLSVSGNFTQTGTGKLTLKLGGAGCASFDRLNVGGTAALAGTLSEVISAPCTPTSGQQFTVLTSAVANGVTGTFSSTPVGFTTSYTSTSVVLKKT